MDFNLTEEHLMIQQAAKDFAVAIITRSYWTWWTSQISNWAGENDGWFRFYGNDGWPKYGGGLDSISYVVAMTEIAKVDASAAVIMSVS
jgi:alkylation response protein AidB-like acyl-CoA dehydrogenase